MRHSFMLWQFRKSQLVRRGRHCMLTGLFGNTFKHAIKRWPDCDDSTCTFLASYPTNLGFCQDYALHILKLNQSLGNFVQINRH